MAGIGFELRKLLRDGSLLGLLRAYGFAGMISSGPWVLSIIGVMIIGLVSVRTVISPLQIKQFLVSVTYLMAGSLILTGALQLLFTRFVADRLFEKKPEAVLPNLMGALTLTSTAAGLLGALIVGILFHETLLYRLLLLGSFVVLCDMWILVCLLSGLKSYRTILWIFFIGYVITIGGALALRPFGLEGLLAGFLVGQAAMLFMMLALVIRSYPADRLVAFDFTRRRQSFYSLALTGLLYNAGIWTDKFLFWMNPSTSERVIGPLRASIIYDLPIFIAYLSLIPGMAVFLVRIETDFAEQYDAFYDAVRRGDTLDHLEHLKDTMVYAIRQGIYEIFKVQGLTVLCLLLAGPRLLGFIGISPFYLNLYNVDMVGVGVQVLLLAILCVFFYLDQRATALVLCAFFAISNAALTLLTQKLGFFFYGYGFAASVSLTSLLGLILLSRKLDRLEFETFMLMH